MRASYKVSDKLQFEVEGEGQKEIFKELASVTRNFWRNQMWNVWI